MFGWRHWLTGHEVWSNCRRWWRTGHPVCCSPWGHKESDTTERLTMTKRLDLKYSHHKKNDNYVKVSANTTEVVILQYINGSDQHILHLKLTLLYIPPYKIMNYGKAEVIPCSSFCPPPCFIEHRCWIFVAYDEHYCSCWCHLNNMYIAKHVLVYLK